MDWNKSNTIFIIVFIILNLFLFSVSYHNIFSDEYNTMSDKKFVEDVENLLAKSSGITISCEIPKDTYLLPMLDTEYKIINIDDEFLEKYLGPGMESIEGVYYYENNNGETLEVIDDKKIVYTMRNKEMGDIKNLDISNEIANFLAKKNIDSSVFAEDYRIVTDDTCIITYTTHYNNITVDNSYMKFYMDKAGIYKFEAQKIIAINEISVKVNTFSAVENLLKLISFTDVKNKEIIGIYMSYYSMEDENWKSISGINSYPAWKVIFSDGTQKHLIDTNY